MTEARPPAASVNKRGSKRCVYCRSVVWTAHLFIYSSILLEKLPLNPPGECVFLRLHRQRDEACFPNSLRPFSSAPFCLLLLLLLLLWSCSCHGGQRKKTVFGLYTDNLKEDISCVVPGEFGSSADESRQIQNTEKNERVPDPVQLQTLSALCNKMQILPVKACVTLLTEQI